MALDAPSAVELVEPEVGDGHVAAIDERRDAGDADQAAPGAGTDQLAQLVVLEEPREHIAARAGVAVDQHRLRSLVRIVRPGPIGTVTTVPVVGPWAVEQLDETVGDLAATVPAFVDHQGFLADLPVELAEELVLTLNARVGDIDVTDLAVGVLLDILAVPLDPCAVTQVGLGSHGTNRDITLVDGLFVALEGRDDRQRRGLAGKPDERGPDILAGINSRAVDRGDDVTLAHAEPVLRQRTDRVGIPRGAAVDLGDPESAVVAALSNLELCAEQPDIFTGLTLAVAAAVVGVPDIEFGDELTDDVGDILTRDGIVDHGEVVREHRVPVHAVHVLDIEEVALATPGVGDQLSPFLAQVHGRAEGEVERLGRLAGLRVYDGKAAGSLRDQFLAIAGHAEAEGHAEHGLLAGLLVTRIDEFQRSGVVRLANVQQLALVVAREVREVARGNTEVVGTSLEVLEVDLDGLRCLAGFLDDLTELILADVAAGA